MRDHLRFIGVCSIIDLVETTIAMNIEAAKNSIIQYIQGIQNEYLISRLHQLIQQFKQRTSNEQVESVVEQVDVLAVAQAPTPHHVSIETLVQQQGYSTEKLRAAYAAIDEDLWADEDVDELLAAIK